MRRREFISYIGTATAWPLAAQAQQSPTRRLGVLVGIENDSEGQIRVKAFETALQGLGWTEGINVHIEYRWVAADPQRLRTYSAELIDWAPDVLVASSTPVAAMLSRQTQTIPIVFLVVTDPVGNGFVTSLARPGGNITGFTNFEISMGGKWLEVLKEIVPSVQRMGIMFNPANAPAVRSYYSPSISPAAQAYSLELVDLPVHDAGEVNSGMEAFARGSGNGLVVLPDNTTVRHRELIVALAEKYRIPTIYPYRYFVTSGGMLSYGIDSVDLYRRAATYVDRILRGVKPGDLPIQQPTKFELVLNVKAMKAIGLPVPPRRILTRADEIIE
jgi:putative ABC transport system substrate-binding protein